MEKDLPTSQTISADMTLTEEQQKIFSSDPATFLIANAVFARLRDSVTELKQLLAKGREEIEVVIDHVLAQMVKSGAIKLAGDRILLSRPNFFIPADEIEDEQLVPKITALLADRILRNYRENLDGVGVDQLRWESFPDHPKVRRKLIDLNCRYIAELRQIQQWVNENPEISGDKLRVTIIMTGNLSPEDF